jgi:hypothetical protein
MGDSSLRSERPRNRTSRSELVFRSLPFQLTAFPFRLENSLLQSWRPWRFTAAFSFTSGNLRAPHGTPSIFDGVEQSLSR